MKSAFTIVATWIVLSQSLSAGDSPRLERAVHDAARAARRANIESVLVLVREDARSTKNIDSEQLLAIVQKQLTRMLEREPQVDARPNPEAQRKAMKTKARRSLRPAEAGAFLKDSDADAVLTADFREYRGRYSMRIALVDEENTYFNSTVSLESRPQAEAEKPAGTKKTKEKKSTSIDGNPEPLAPPPEAKGSTGYIVRRTSQTGIARTRGGPGSRGIPVRGFGSRDKRSDSLKEGERTQKNAEKPESSREDEKPTEGGDDAADGEEKSDNRARQGPVPSSPLAKDVVRFASSMIGKQVGNGQCWTLAAEALKAAGAEPPKGYTFGDEIPLENIEPGDILQFKTARFEEPGYWAVMGTPDHTAVVYSLGERTFILHQNVGGKKYVQSFDLDFDNMTSGRVQAYRPRPARR